MKKVSYIFLLIIIFTLSYQKLNQITSYQKIINKSMQIENDNPYIIATLEFKNSNKLINLVQRDNNTFFLEHDEFGNESNIGSIFLDYRNNLNDRKLLIYGHNSKTIEAPFHFLENYLNKEYSKENNILILKRNNNQKNSHQLFTVFVAKDDLRHVNLNFNNEEYYEHLLWLKNQSLFDFNISISQDDSIILMQTCYYKPENSYLIVGFKKI